MELNQSVVIHVQLNNPKIQQYITISSRQMELEESQIINLAVNIFQNVGIKRYIGQIEALRHEDIYFQIYKIIFPDSMINIFKISQSNLTTGQKIQKIIQEISSIIKLDLYHISGEAIAQGNRNHLTNWLQLLEALSNNCIAYQTYHGGGSAPDRDREMYKQFQEDDYYTVQGVHGQFEKHVYTDQKPDETQQEEQQSQHTPKHKNRSFAHVIKNQRQKPQLSFDKQQQQDQLNRSFRKSESSRNSNVLKPIQAKKKSNSKIKNSDQKKVTFKIEQGTSGSKNNQYQKNMKNTMKKQNQNERKTATSIQQQSSNTFKKTKAGQGMFPQYGYFGNIKFSTEQKILRKKKSFILKMHKIEQQMERKRINDEVAKFQSWVRQTNQQSVQTAVKIQQQNRERKQYINKKIAQRENYVNSLTGRQEVFKDIKQIFKKQRHNQKRMRKIIQQQQMKQVVELMDLNFAAQVENMVMASIGQ